MQLRIGEYDESGTRYTLEFKCTVSEILIVWMGYVCSIYLILTSNITLSINGWLAYTDIGI